MMAARLGDLAWVEELLRSDPSSVEETDIFGRGLRAPRGSERRGQTALHWAAMAARYGRVDVVRRLLEARAALEAKDNSGRRPQQREELRRKRFVLTVDGAFLRCNS